MTRNMSPSHVSMPIYSKKFSYVVSLMNQTLYRATSTEGHTNIRKYNVKHEFQSGVRPQAKDPRKDLITCRKPLN